MVVGFPKRVAPRTPVPAPRVEFKPAPPPTVPVEDEDGRRILTAPLAPASTRPPPTTTPPAASLRMPPPPPPRPPGSTNVRPTRPTRTVAQKAQLDFSKQQPPPPPPKPPAPKMAERGSRARCARASRSYSTPTTSHTDMKIIDDEEAARIAGIDLPWARIKADSDWRPLTEYVPTKDYVYVTHALESLAIGIVVARRGQHPLSYWTGRHRTGSRRSIRSHGSRSTTATASPSMSAWNGSPATRTRTGSSGSPSRSMRPGCRRPG
jgi:hypothetical protein